MNLLFLLTLGTGAAVIQRALGQRETKPLGRVALYALSLYLLTILSAAPLFWIDRWSLGLHTLCAALAALFILPLALRASRNPPSPWIFQRHLLLYLAILLAGLALQTKPIYHLYATHDPTAYLSGALNVSRTGHFSHQHPLVPLARENESIAPLINWETGPEPWRLFRNYGVVPENTQTGVGRFHGLPGATLFLAIGQALFGEAHLLRIHLVHFIVAFLLMAALLDRWVRRRTPWKAIALALFAFSPLVAPLFREPLSEPLACIFFLGMVFSLTQFRRDHRGMLYLFLACISASILVRVSGLLYVPFFCIGAWVLVRGQQGSRLFTCVAPVALGLSIALLFRLSPNYVSEILLFYTSIVFKKIPSLTPLAEAILLTAVVLVVATAAVFVYRIARSWISFPRALWKLLWIGYAAGMAACLIFRYGKLLTRLTHNIGGFPFVLFNLDSLLFYGCPLVVLLGLFYWFHRLYKMPLGRYAFLQTYLPFCLFFYGAFRFLPLNVQVNFQRYLLIELLPLSILGAGVFASRLARKSAFHRWGIAGGAFALVWTGGITFLINRNDVSENAHAYYAQFRNLLDSVTADGKKPVLIGVRGSWKESAFLHPLTTAFGYSVGFAPYGFTFKEQEALREFRNQGYEPILVVEGEKLHSETALDLPNSRWERWKQIDHCYNYAAFGLGAPPLELARTCAAFSLFRLHDANPPTRAAGIRPAWGLRHIALPATLTYWVGFEVKECLSGREAFARLRFFPEENFQVPVAQWDGEPLGRWSITELSKNGSRASHVAELSVPLPTRCERGHQIDIFFPPSTPDGTPRRAELLEYGIREKIRSAEIALVKPQRAL